MLIILYVINEIKLDKNSTIDSYFGTKNTNMHIDYLNRF